MRRIVALLTLTTTLLTVFPAVYLAAQDTSRINELVPASLLVYPVIDSRSGFGTVIAVTNTNSNRTVVTTNNFRVGDVRVHFYYVESGTCQMNNRVELLTPNDMFAILATSHSTESIQGYLFTVAEDPETGDPIDFDYLIGDEIVIDVGGNRSWALKAYGIKALAAERSQEGDASNAGFLFTQATNNGGNNDQYMDFNGFEYQFLPHHAYIANFLQYSTGVMETDLVLVAPFNGDTRVELNFLFYDNEEDVFSRDYHFTCWTTEDLDDISRVVTNLGGTTSEIESGWARIDGDWAIDILTGRMSQDPPILGAVMQTVTVSQTLYLFGHLLHFSGVSDDYFSGSLPGRFIPTRT